MKIENKIIDFKTKELLEFIDITDKVIEFVKKTGIKDGLVNIQSLHTTVGVIVNENEPLLIEDFKEHLEKIAPNSSKYKHDICRILRYSFSRCFPHKLSRAFL